MKIFFTKKEYRLLVDMLYLADWMMNSNIIIQDQKSEDHATLKKRLLSYSKQMDAEDVIEYSKEMNEFFETGDYEEKLHDRFIEPYDNETFWEDLMSKLAVRDLVEVVGVEQYESMDNRERSLQLETIRQGYAMEFEHYGLERMKIDAQESVM